MAAGSITTRPRRVAPWFIRWVGYLLIADALLAAFRAVDFSRFIFCEDCRPLFGSLGVLLYAVLALVAWRLWVAWGKLQVGEAQHKWKGVLIALYACFMFPIIFMFSLGSIADIAAVEIPPAAFNVVGLAVSLASVVLLAITVVALLREK